MTTQELAGRRLIRAAKEGATWVFTRSMLKLMVLFARPRRQLYGLEP